MYKLHVSLSNPSIKSISLLMHAFNKKKLHSFDGLKLHYLRDGQLIVINRPAYLSSFSLFLILRCKWSQQVTEI